MTPSDVTLTNEEFPTITAVRRTGEVSRWIVSDSAVETCAEMVFVHGLCEHAFRFLPLARRLARQGVRVHLFHQLGHGVHGADVERFDWLAQSYFNGRRPEDVLDDLEDGACDGSAEVCAGAERVMRSLDLWRNVERAEAVVRAASISRLPLFVGGHSLGGLVACLAAQRLADERNAEPIVLAGVTLLSPGLRPRGSPRGGWFEQAVVSLSWRLGRITVLRPLHALLSLVTRIPVEIDVQWASHAISDLSNECQLHAIDPLILDRVPLPFLGRIEALMLAAQREATKLTVAIWLAAGESDRVVDTRGVEEFCHSLSGNASAANQIQVLSGFAPHDPLRSSRAEELTGSLIDWINACLRRSPPRVR